MEMDDDDMDETLPLPNCEELRGRLLDDPEIEWWLDYNGDVRFAYYPAEGVLVRIGMQGRDKIIGEGYRSIASEYVQDSLDTYTSWEYKIVHNDNYGVQVSTSDGLW